MKVDLRLALLIGVAEVLSMAGFSTYPAYLPELRALWGLSNASAGLIAGSLFGGYVLAVPFLSGLTDRFDARAVYLLSNGAAALGSFGFGLFADGVLSASLFQGVVGIGLAGTFMPGLRVLTDRLREPTAQNRYAGIYTATFAIGMGGSLALAGGLQAWVGWRVAFALVALGPLVAAAALWIGTAPSPRRPAAPPGAPVLNLTAVVRNRRARAYMLGYAAHCWEVFGLRSWMVAFLVFSNSMKPGAPSWSEAAIAAVITLLAWPSAVLGNELAIRFGYPRMATIVVAGSALLACFVGFSAPLASPVVVVLVALYFASTMADTSVLTAGVLAAARPQERGATLGVYSLIGFSAGLLAPYTFGVILDWTGGAGRVLGWGAAFGSLALGLAVAPIMLRLFGRSVSEAATEAAGRSAPGQSTSLKS